jgi:hypothetical protein
VDSGVALGTVVLVGVCVLVGITMTVGSVVGVDVTTTLGWGVGVGVGDLLLNPSVIAVMLIAITSTKAINAIFTVFFILF